MTDELTRTDRLWLGAHGDVRYAHEWAELQQREADQLAIKRTKIEMQRLDEAGTPYHRVMVTQYVDPIAVIPERGN